jgi:hypothetical protein
LTCAVTGLSRRGHSGFCVLLGSSSLCAEGQVLLTKGGDSRSSGHITRVKPSHKYYRLDVRGPTGPMHLAPAEGWWPSATCIAPRPPVESAVRRQFGGQMRTEDEGERRRTKEHNWFPEGLMEMEFPSQSLPHEAPPGPCGPRSARDPLVRPAGPASMNA